MHLLGIIVVGAIFAIGLSSSANQEYSQYLMSQLKNSNASDVESSLKICTRECIYRTHRKECQCIEADKPSICSSCVDSCITYCAWYLLARNCNATGKYWTYFNNWLYIDLKLIHIWYKNTQFV